MTMNCDKYDDDLADLDDYLDDDDTEDDEHPCRSRGQAAIATLSQTAVVCGWVSI
jgi:hypothetical protein